jgi:hypothetical protein
MATLPLTAPGSAAQLGEESKLSFVVLQAGYPLLISG